MSFDWKAATGFFTPKKPAHWLVLSLIALFLLGLCQESRADTTIELGHTFLRGKPSGATSVVLSERFAGKYDIGVVLLDEQTCKCSQGDLAIGKNMAVQMQRIVPLHIGRVDLRLGIGAAYWQNTNYGLSSPFSFSLLFGVDLTDRVSLNIRHWSNARTRANNNGQDTVLLSYRFGK